jgi:hypothetical protein
MAGPTITNYGAPEYQDDVSNWREIDAHFLRNRSVLRFPSQDALDEASVPGATPGSLVFVANDADEDDTVEVGVDPYFTGYTSDGWRRLLGAANLVVPEATDTVTAVRVRHADAGGGLSLKATGALVADSRLEVGTDQVSIESGVISVKNGANTRTVQVNGSGKLVVDGTLVGSALETAGAVTAASAAISGGATVGGTLAITGTVTAAAAVNAASVTATGAVQGATVVGTTHVAVDQVRLLPTGLTRNGGTALVTVNATDVSVLAGSGGFQFRRSSGETWTQVAGVVTSTSAPGGGDVHPDGTIWVQVA